MLCIMIDVWTWVPALEYILVVGRFGRGRFLVWTPRAAVVLADESSFNVKFWKPDVGVKKSEAQRALPRRIKVKRQTIFTCDSFLTGCVLTWQILLQGKNPGVLWEYTLPRTERKPDYSWGVVRSDCSAPCAGGETVCVCMWACTCLLKLEEPHWSLLFVAVMHQCSGHIFIIVTANKQAYIVLQWSTCKQYALHFAANVTM